MKIVIQANIERRQEALHEDYASLKANVFQLELKEIRRAGL